MIIAMIIASQKSPNLGDIVKCEFTILKQTFKHL